MADHRESGTEQSGGPKGSEDRYERLNEKLGKGAFKTVYKGYDTETGREVAWNEVPISGIGPKEQDRIREETKLLSKLKHDHIIEFYHVWEDPKKQLVIFTTEIMESGTIKEYIGRVKNVKLKIVKLWCRQILAALKYLHGHSPPIIHRDLKCDNIFIHGSTGKLRIGDFGLSAQTVQTVKSVIGTPQYMAPELWEETYNETVDIYAFGMCVLEMTTGEYPWQECRSAVQIWRKVSAKQQPEILERIRSRGVREFIKICLDYQSNIRLSAKELLEHPFLIRIGDSPFDQKPVQVADKATERKKKLIKKKPDKTKRTENKSSNEKVPKKSPTAASVTKKSPDATSVTKKSPAEASVTKKSPAAASVTKKPPAAASVTKKQVATASVDVNTGPVNTLPGNSPNLHTQESRVRVRTEISNLNDESAMVGLSVGDGTKMKRITFTFQFKHDTPEDIAKEMVDGLKLSKDFGDQSVEGMIARELHKGIEQERRKNNLANSAKNLTNSGPTSATANTVSPKITAGINTKKQKEETQEALKKLVISNDSQDFKVNLNNRVAKNNDRKKGESVKTTAAKSSKKEKTIISNDVALKSAPTPTPARPATKTINKTTPTAMTAKTRAGGTEKPAKKENLTPKRENKITPTSNTKNAQNARPRTNSCMASSPKPNELSVDTLSTPTYPQSAPTTPTAGSFGEQKQTNLTDHASQNPLKMTEMQRKREEGKKAEALKAEAKKAEDKKAEDRKRKKKKTRTRSRRSQEKISCLH